MAIAEQDREWFCGELQKAKTSLYRLALSITGSDADAQDAVAEAVYKAYLHGEKLRDKGKCRQWLLKITANEARAICRSRKRTVPMEVLSERAAPASEADDTLWQAVQRLKQDQREAVVLFYYEDLPTEEIARIVGATPGAVRTRLSRAREQLRRMLEEVEHHG